MFVRVTRHRPSHLSGMNPLFGFDRTASDSLSDISRQFSRGAEFPAVDIAEREHAYDLIAELPGVKREEIKISVENGTLSLRGEGNRGEFSEGTKVLLRETNTKPFERLFKLSEDIDVSGISAEMKDGILKIQLPKLEQSIAKEIRIQ